MSEASASEAAEDAKSALVVQVSDNEEKSDKGLVKKK
jgi:hypothetical protein